MEELVSQFKQIQLNCSERVSETNEENVSEGEQLKTRAKSITVDIIKRYAQVKRNHLMIISLVMK